MEKDYAILSAIFVSEFVVFLSMLNNFKILLASLYLDFC